MEIDVNLRKPTTANGLELKTISAGSYSNNNGQQQLLQHQHHQQHNNNNNNPHNGHIRLCTTAAATSSSATSSSLASSSSTPNPQPSGLTLGCCGVLSRLLCSSNTRGKTATSSSDYNTYNNGGGVGGGAMSLYGNANGCCNSSAAAQHNPSSYMNLLRKPQTHRRTPQEIYFESRGKSCKKLLKFNGNSNKILLYPEEGWARTASSSYWTITPCWWQPNRCRIEEFAGTQRQVTKAKMVALEQKGSLLIVGHFRTKNPSSSSSASSASMTSSSSTATTTSTATTCYPLASGKDNDEFKLYLSSNISMEDYNMGYCLTGFVERRCQQTNTFQMTHFAVIKRQWPSLAQSSKNTKTVSSSSFSCTSGNGGGGGSSSSGCVGGGNAASKST